MMAECTLRLVCEQVAMLRSLRHRNIVQFYGACLEPDCFFIVTELMHGETTSRAPSAAVCCHCLGSACVSDSLTSLLYSDMYSLAQQSIDRPIDLPSAFHACNNIFI